MTKRQTVRWSVAAAAMTVVMGLSSSALAQLPAQGQDGHATDANNRVGSNGINSQRPNAASLPGNSIVTRDVTGGREFRGPVGYSDNGAFTGPISGRLMDNFVRNTSGVPMSNGAPSDLTQAHVFYGDHRGIAPPAGSIAEGFNGGYIGSSLTSPSTLSNTLNTGSAANSLQGRTMSRDALELNASLNPSGYPGLAVPNAPMNTSMFNPAFVQPTWSAGQSGLNQPLSPGLQYPGVAGPQDAVQKMQAELQEAAGLRLPNTNTNPGALQQQGPGQNQLENNSNGQNGSPANSQLSNPLQQGAGQPGQGAQQQGASLNSKPLNENMNSQQAYRDVAPSLQSPQLAELFKRLDSYNSTTPVTDTQGPAGTNKNASQRPNGDVIAKPATPVVPGAVGTTPGTTPPAFSRVTPAAPAAPPLVMRSFAEGIKAKGLHDVMASAEDLMRQDKFESAIDKYELASRVAPNNSLIAMGRAIAELGAGFYAQADRDLRLVYRLAPELLGARVELSAFYNPQRLEFLKKDLTNLAANDAKSERPWFLMGFIAYNTGNPDEAQKDLTEAQSRGSQLDWTIRRLKERWNLQTMMNPSLDKVNEPTTFPTQREGQNK